MKLALKQLDKLQANAQSYIDSYGPNPVDFDPNGPPSPSQTLALVKEVKALRAQVKVLKAGAHPRKRKSKRIPSKR